MKVIVFSDAHSNLPALKSMLSAARKEGYDAIFHTGDAVGVGPWPKETLETLFEVPRIHLIKGNHDEWFSKGVPKDCAQWINNHYLWMSQKVPESFVSAVAAWPYLSEHEFEGVRTAFVHYALSACGKRLSLPIGSHVAVDLDSLYTRHSSLLVFHGHRHKASDVRGKVRYINPGSLGCWHKPAGRYLEIRFDKKRFTVRHKTANYDWQEVLKGFKSSKMPDAEMILNSYFSF